MATFNEKKTCSQRMENFQRFLWNPDTGQLMGRTLINWGMQYFFKSMILELLELVLRPIISTESCFTEH